MSFVSGAWGDWHVYAEMILVAGAIGYLTKLVAVEMMFRPAEFKGIPPFLGWQGIIPRNAQRMGRIAVDLMVGRLVTSQELIDRIDIEDMQARLREPMMQIADDLSREILSKHQPFLWEATPEVARRLMIWNVKRGASDALDRLMTEVRENVDEVLDLRAMALDALVRDNALLVRMVRSVGDNEMKFIVRVGLPFGLVLGLVQAGMWAVTHSEWIVPVFGAATGLITDYLALQMIFRPIEPRRYFGLVKWQGLFHKNRKAVTEDYSRIIAEEILTPTNFLEGLLNGPQSEAFMGLITREIQRVIDNQAGLAKPLVVAAVGGRGYQELKADAVAAVVARMRSQPPEFTELASQAMDLPGLIRSKMEMMTKDEYESLLRPAFKQDEWKLVTVGALLGFLIGELQVQFLLT